MLRHNAPSSLPYCAPCSSVTVDRGIPYNDLVNDTSLDRMAMYTTVFGPWKNDLAAPLDSDPRGRLVSTGLTEKAQNRGMLVQPYTFRPEANQMAPYFAGVYFDEVRLAGPSGRQER